MSIRVAYILCPPGILAGLTMTDPDPESIWLLFGPLNALIYGAVGYTLWLLRRRPLTFFDPIPNHGSLAEFLGSR
jgi:hypothetical protein